MNNDYCVYMHTSPNGKKYIGITCCKPRNRRWQNGYGYVDNKHFFSAIKKYGWQSIQHEILVDNLTADEAGRLEIEYINRYNTTDRRNGYNLNQGGQVGYHLSHEHKKKIGEANSGKRNGMYGHHYTKEEREYMSEHSVWNGRKHTEESRKKMSEYAKAHPETKSHKGEEHPMYGKHHSDESKIKMSESAKKRGYCGSKNKRVDMLTVDDVYIRTFGSIQEAARFIGKKNGAPNIRSVCLGDRKKAHGFKWRYADANESAV